VKLLSRVRDIYSHLILVHWRRRYITICTATNKSARETKQWSRWFARPN